MSGGVEMQRAVGEPSAQIEAQTDGMHSLVQDCAGAQKCGPYFEGGAIRTRRTVGVPQRSTGSGVMHSKPRGSGNLFDTGTIPRRFIAKGGVVMPSPFVKAPRCVRRFPAGFGHESKQVDADDDAASSKSSGS